MAAAAMVWALINAIVPAKAVAAAELRPVEHVSGSFLGSANVNASLAVDAAGSEHVVIDRNRGDVYTISYGLCSAGNCVTSESWAEVQLRTVHKITGHSQLRLTPQGKPRILLTVGDADRRTTYLYAACDSACTTLGGWTVLDLGSVFNKLSEGFEVTDDHSFALDPQGRPRFVYSFQDPDTLAGPLHYAACDSGCAVSVTNWTKTTASQPTGAVPDRTQFFYSSLSLDFTAAGQPRVGGFVWEQGVTNIAYLECNSACSAPEPVAPASPNWRVGAVAQEQRDSKEAVMRLDNNDVPHLIVGGKGLTSTLERHRCATACTSASNWSATVMPFDGADADLVFDAAAG